MSKDIANKSTIIDTLKKYNLYANKNFGQNFLIDANIVKSIVSKSDVSKDTCVIEIGPGIGSLTQELSRHAKKVICIEIDTKLQPVLEETLSDCDNVTIVYEDFLKLDLTWLKETYLKDEEDVKVVANLPYYITTPILIKLFEHKQILSLVSITAMMQKEVALRLSAKKDTKDYNSLTILTQYYSEPSIIINVPKNVFIPPPNVDSSVVLFKMRESLTKPNNEELFFKLLRVLFKQRRKTILNNLNELYNDKEVTRSILEANNLAINLRAENLTLNQIIDLSNYIGDNHD